MSGISSGIGLISGINSAQLIEQLMAIEARPIQFLQNRIGLIDIERTALLSLSAQLLAIQNAAGGFNKPSFFNRFAAASSNEKVVQASASEKAAPGTYTFQVHSLVASHSIMSKGFADSDKTPVGTGVLTFEVGQGQVNKSTSLDTLNGGNGVRRGVITITDRAGATAEIDLRTALTVEDVLTAINSNTKVNVRANVTSEPANAAAGDRIFIEDLTGGAGSLIIADTIGGTTASDLGIIANVAAPRFDGRDLVRLSDSTLLTTLNDGNGVDRAARATDLIFETSAGTFNVSLTDILELDTDLRILNSGNGVRLGKVRITDRNGKEAEIDLSTARTVREVNDALNGAGLAISVSIVNSHLQIADTSGIAEDKDVQIKVEDVTGFAAADLGIAGESNPTSITGRDIYRVQTLGDVIRAINFATGNNSLVEASVSDDGNGITLRTDLFENTVKILSASGSGAAADLGLADATLSYNTNFTSRHLVAGLNTVLLSSLRGGRGVAGGTVSFTDRLGQSAVIDFTGVHTLQDVVDRINADEATGFTATINSAGNGMVLTDTSGGNNPQVIITDVTGTLAADLGIAVPDDPTDPYPGNVVQSGNLQLQYISRQTPLEELNFGLGVNPGVVRITDSNGAVYSVNISSSIKTVGQIIDTINNVTPDHIQARINDTGDGLLISDSSTGSSTLTIEDAEGSQTAADLSLAGEAKSGTNFIDGSVETRIDIDATDTLNDLAQKINAVGGGFTASVINDGGATNPYSLTVTSNTSGRVGQLVFDAGSLDLGFQTLARAQDAVITVGDQTSSNPMLISSSSNTIDSVIPGVTLNLLGAGDENVTVTVSQDIDGIVESISTFVDSYNDLQDAIDENTRFDSETFERAPLFGNRTVDVIGTRLHRVLLQPYGLPSAPIRQLSAFGLRLIADNRLEFDETRFREVYEENPERVEQIFNTPETGFGAVVLDALEELTSDTDGLITRDDQVLAEQQELLNDRIEDLNVVLEAKRARLQAQFASLETALAALQDQQSALAALGQLA